MENKSQNSKLNKIAYYPGCSLNSTAIDFNVSTKKLLKILDIEFEEIEDWNCCGTTPAHNISEELPIILSARNLLLAKGMGYEDILSPCVACHNKLHKASKIINSDSELKNIRDEKIRNSVFEKLEDMGFDCNQSFNFKTYSIVQFLFLKKDLIRQKYENLKNKIDTEVKLPILKNLKPVCYYGCMLLRPKNSIKFDDPENPTSMEEILREVDIKCKEFQFKTECCGAILSLTHKNVVLKLSKGILEEATDSGANSIIVFCQLCQQNLDMRQQQINKYYKESYNLPIFYITQILGLALGLSYKDVMIDKLFVEPKYLKESNI